MRYLQKLKNLKKISIDFKDRKILDILGNDVRTPLTQISKKVGLSRDAVNYRINGYKSQGLIQGYRTMVNISNLGYQNYHIFIKLNNPTNEIEEKILFRLAKMPNIRAILKFSGNFDLEIALIAKDLVELDSLITKIVDNCAGFIQDYEVLAIVKTYAASSFPKNFLDNPENETISSNKDYTLDKIDILILKIIGEEANLSLSEIATRVKLSADAVAYRIKNLKSAGIIIKFVPVINYAALDYSMHAILVNINPLNEANEKKLQDFLKINKNALWAVKTIGRFNLIVYFLIKNTEDLQETILELRSLFPKQITHYETMLAYEEYKYVYFPAGLF
jgi:Lrp/AsnC family leucine-responsive transcriptional regulator